MEYVTSELGAERPESLNDYWRLFAGELRSAMPGTSEHRIAYRNYWLASLSMVRQMPLVGMSLEARAEAFNGVYDSGLQSLEPVFFTHTQIQDYERIVLSSIVLARHQNLPDDRLQLLHMLHDGLANYELNE